MPRRVDAEPDPDLVGLLYAVPTQNLEQAAKVLRVSPRHVRRLIESGQVEKIGAGQWQRITSKSILGRLGLPVDLETCTLGDVNGHREAGF